MAASCTAINPIDLWTRSSLDNANLTLDVKQHSEPGTFSIAGTASLPNGTKLNVLAVRQLRLKQSPLVNAEPRPTYSILTYETVTVENDRWQTTLSLWQITPDGQYKEAWQLQERELQLDVTPDAEVFFMVTLTPLDNLAEIEQQLAARNQQFGQRYLQTTSEGDRYLQVGKVMQIALPTDRQAISIGIRPEDINGGWGNRFLDLPDLPNRREFDFPENRQTDAPVRQDEFLY